MAKLLQKVSEPLRDAPDIFFRRRSARGLLPSASVIAFVIQDHPHRAGSDLGRKLVRRLACHGSTLSGVGASDKPGTVHAESPGSSGSEAWPMRYCITLIAKRTTLVVIIQ